MKFATHESLLFVLRRGFAVGPTVSSVTFDLDRKILFVKAGSGNFQPESIGRFQHIDAGLIDH